MAARTKRPNHTDETRQKIQTSQLLNRLQNHIYTSPADPDMAKKMLTDSQVRAALGLLKKTLPDLSATELTGVDGKDLIPESVELKLVRPNATRDT